MIQALAVTLKQILIWVLIAYAVTMILMLLGIIPARAFVHDMAEMTVSGTPGTGTITLGSAMTGYQTFSAAGVIDGEIVPYAIKDGTSWEVGHGTYTASGTSLSRGPIYSSNSNSAVSLSSSAIVWIAPLSEEFGTTYAVALTSNNYNVLQSDCNKILLLPTGTTPTVTFPNINTPAIGKCVVGLIQTTGVAYTIQAAAGGTMSNASSLTQTQGVNSVAVVVLTIPSASAATWVWQ